MEPLEKLKALTAVISAVIIPVVILVVGNNYSAATKERELQGRFVELAVDILREAPTSEARNLRGWATQIITTYSGVPLSEEAKRDLIETTPLPISSTEFGAGFKTARDVQEMFKALGLYDGPIEDFYSPAFREVVRTFQRDHELPADGKVGRMTLQTLKTEYEKAASKKSGGGSP